VQVEVEGNDVSLSKPSGQIEKHAQADLFLAIKGLLAETVAFRGHFQGGESEKLFVK
jgi:hypothetical protein